MSSNPFDRLADDTILDIIDHLYISRMKCDVRIMGPCPLNKDIWRTSLCCRRFQRLAFPLLYHNIYITSTDFWHKFLRKVIEYPAHARLVKTLCLYHPSCRLGEINNSDSNLFIETAKERFLPEDIISDLEKRHEDAYLWLLLHLLPHLEGLCLDAGEYYDHKLWAYFPKFIGDRLLPFSLRSLSLVANGKIDMQVLIPAFLCPAMTKICVYGFVSQENGKRLWYPPPGVDVTSWYKTSKVERLELGHIGISNHDMETLIRLPRALKEFACYENCTIYDQIYDANGLREALDFAAETLELLDLRWETEGPLHGYTPWSLANFSSLKTLHVVYQLLFGEDWSTAPLVAGRLPPTLEVLAMYELFSIDWYDEGRIEAWRQLLAHKSSTCIPRLRLIANVFDFGLLKPLVELANSCGVQVAQRKEDLELWFGPRHYE
jgi:hypothetical protein